MIAGSPTPKVDVARDRVPSDPDIVHALRAELLALARQGEAALSGASPDGIAPGSAAGFTAADRKARLKLARRLCDEGRGWAGDDGYMVAVALFTRNPDVPGDRAGQLLRALQID